MIRFFTQVHPKIPPRSNIRHPECLAIVKGNFVCRGTQIRNLVDKADKPVKGREEKESVQMPGFAHPEPMSDEGLLTQKVRQQIEEHKRKKAKPSLRPEGRE